MVIKILTDPKFRLIDVNNSYQSGTYAKSYRLNPNLWMLYPEPFPHKIITIKSVISNNYYKKVEPTEIFITENLPGEKIPYNYLYKNYNREILTLCEDVHNYVKAYEDQLSKKLKGLNKTKKLVYFEEKCQIRIDKLKTSIKKIEEGDFNVRIKKNNRRFYSELTYGPKQIRRFLKINNNKNLVEIDINNSHMSMLLIILNDKFLTFKNYLSLYNIKQEYYNNLNKDFNNTLYSYKIINNILINKNINSLSSYNDSFLLYMSSLFSSTDLLEFKSLPFNNNFYEHLNEILFVGKKDRCYIKKNIMMYLNLKKNRSGNKLIRAMNSRFRHIAEVIDIFNSDFNPKGNLSTLLQCVESVLFLEVGIKNVLKEIPDLNFVTVHDSIIVEEKYGQKVMAILSNSISEVTGSRIQLDYKKITSPIDEIEETVQKQWKKISTSYKKHLRKIKAKSKQGS